MKKAGTSYWTSPNIGADNSSGFTGLPSCSRNYDVSFSYAGFGFFWSSTEVGISDAWFRYLYNFSSDLGRNYSDELNGFSVRCLRD